MPLTTDQNAINSALRLFGITAQDYYLEFTGTTIYMHWIADTALILSYLQGDFVALDIQVKGVWRDTQSMSIVSPGHYNCRYILETR